MYRRVRVAVSERSGTDLLSAAKASSQPRSCRGVHSLQWDFFRFRRAAATTQHNTIITLAFVRTPHLHAHAVNTILLLLLLHIHTHTHAHLSGKILTYTRGIVLFNVYIWIVSVRENAPLRRVYTICTYFFFLFPRSFLPCNR